jgi:hypothetical protein
MLRFRLWLLTANIVVAGGIAVVFAWGLHGVHRFPTEAAVYVAVLLMLLIANAVYIWRIRIAS